MQQLILLVDALGWLTVERTDFLRSRLPFRRKLTTVFGYSSTAVPSLITGAMPVDHGHWFLFRRDAAASPFKEARWISKLPGRLGQRWRVRTKLQEYWRRKAGIGGYFSLYNIPLEILGELAPVETTDTWAPGTFPQTPSLIDYLEKRGEPYFVSDWRIPDEQKFTAAARAIEQQAPKVVVLYLTEVDAMQHQVGTNHPELDRTLHVLEERIQELMARMEANGELGVSLFSDHGMTEIHETRDLIGELEASGLIRDRDYRGFFDSTVARFWEIADKEALDRTLSRLSWGKTLDPRTLEGWGVHFPGGEYGEVFFLADPGVLILPSDMGREPLAAMHGYDPADPTSDACFLADREVPIAAPHITSVLDALKSRLDGGR